MVLMRNGKRGNDKSFDGALHSGGRRDRRRARADCQRPARLLWRRRAALGHWPAGTADVATASITKKLAAAERGGASGGGASGGGASGGVWRRYDVMLCTPLWRVSLLRKGAQTLASLEYLVLDEADKLLELGFLEQCDEVLAACDGATV